MEFKKYQHIERFGNDEVEGIELGECYIFPKIDGTNSSIWLSDKIIRAGSRKRQLEINDDNQGFYKCMIDDENIFNYLHNHKNHRLFGEWLVPHSLKTYRESAWRKFYIFDIAIDLTDEETGIEYIPYNIYQEELEKYNLDYIPAIGIMKNANQESLIKWLEKNTFLIEDGKGYGEGIVIKNYGFHNKYGRQTWAKIVRTEFKENHINAMGTPEVKAIELIEQKIIDNYCTDILINKVYFKIKNEMDGWRSQYIPRLLQTVYYDLIVEESWNFIKEFKNPIINFKTLQTLVNYKIKEIKKELF